MGTNAPELRYPSLPVVVTTVIDALAAHPAVTAITLGGSRATARDDQASDQDIEVFVDGEVPSALRRELALRFDPDPEIDNSQFGPTDEWSDRASGVAIDIAYFERDWFEGTIRDVIERHHPELGYTTAFWHTLRHARPMFDRAGWLAEMQTLAATPYPEALRRNVVAWNHPVLRDVRSSWRHQIELAVMRDDPVSVNHRVAALLASVFDIVFALTRTLHPGEKRLLTHVARLGDAVPPGFDAQVRALLCAAGNPEGNDMLAAVDAVCNTVDAMIEQHGLRVAATRVG
ncbi:MAG TPA: hypothetical protein VGR22_06250 [Thermomicrobiales bacterium]|nr:hypothetical protein [Thermomicrobiales bacterium]